MQYVKWNYGTIFNWGERPTGTWKLIVSNHPTRSVPLIDAELYAWHLRFYGFEVPPETAPSAPVNATAPSVTRKNK